MSSHSAARATAQVQANSRASILATIEVSDDGACAVSAEMLPPYECYYEASTRRLVATAFARDVELFVWVRAAHLGHRPHRQLLRL